MTNPVTDQPFEPVEPPPHLPLRDSDEIQGNILAGFLKDHQTFLLLQFADTRVGRAYLTELMPRLATTRQVATFNAQFSNARRLRGGDAPANLKAVWVNLGLTAAGLQGELLHSGYDGKMTHNGNRLVQIQRYRKSRSSVMWTTN